jgi:hypothetical protein
MIAAILDALAPYVPSMFSPKPNVAIADPFMGAKRLRYGETIEFYGSIEHELISGRPVVVTMVGKRTPPKTSSFWWLLAHAENWMSYREKIETLSDGLDQNTSGLFYKLRNIRPTALLEWLVAISSPEYHSPDLSGYRVGLYTDGDTILVSFTPTRKH